MNLLHANDRPGAHPPSWYAASTPPLAPQPELRGAARADICVVGGGYTGLSAALHLAEAGHDVVLLEAQRVGFGASGRNGGQMGSGQRLEQAELERLVGPVRARALWDIAEEAKALVRARIERHAIPAALKPGIVHACRTEAEVAHARANAEHLARHYDYPLIEPLGREALREIVPSAAYVGGDIDRGAGHLHPLALALGLARACLAAGVRIFERTEVHRIDPARPGRGPHVAGPKGGVDCERVILAANGYLGALDGHVAARVMPINNFIVATAPLGARAAQVLRADVAVADSRFVVNYWRLSQDGRLLFGGGESYGYRFPDIVATVRRPMLEVYPGLADVPIEHAWGGTLAITRSRLPCFAAPKAGVLSASGFSGHGVAMAVMAGQILAQAAQGEGARFELMAGLPAPPFPGGVLARAPLLAAAMTWFALRDRLGR